MAPTRGRPAGLSATSARTPSAATAMPSRAAERGEQQALRQQLPDQPASSGAERRAQRELAAPLRAAREQQVRHVHAGDREHQHHRAEDGEERRPDAAGQLVLQRRDERTACSGRRSSGCRSASTARPSASISRVASIDATPGRKPPDRAQVMAPLPSLRRERSVVLQRRPQRRPPAPARSRNRAASRR